MPETPVRHLLESQLNRAGYIVWRAAQSAEVLADQALGDELYELARELMRLHQSLTLDKPHRPAPRTVRAYLYPGLTGGDRPPT